MLASFLPPCEAVAALSRASHFLLQGVQVITRRCASKVKWWVLTGERRGCWKKLSGSALCLTIRVYCCSQVFGG